MTTITTNNAGPASAASATSSTKSAALGQADFLKLMTAQMSAQDPFAPMDNSQFLAQLAQFSQVAGIAEMNASLSTIAASLSGNRVGDASSWIGQDVLLATDIAGPLPGGGYAGELRLGETPDADATLSFADADGNILYTQPIGTLPTGSASWNWDGRQADGSTYTGPVRMIVNGVDSDKVDLSSWARVRGVRSPSGGQAAQIVTDLGAVTPDQVVQVGR